MPLAVTKIWPVKGRLDHLITYILNPQKTEQQLFAHGINCTPQSALAEMNSTKVLFGKKGGTVAFHCYQSFKPGEATPEVAHAIGASLAQTLWGERFQVVVTTHLDKDHIHNHIAINAVSFTDGLRFHSDAKEYRRIRELSDKLCKEHGLSVIQDAKPGRAQQYGEWKAEREGKQTWRSLVKRDIDEAIAKAMTDKQFYQNLRTLGYDIKQGKDISVRPPGKERYVRLARNFGEAYTYESVAARILENKRVMGISKPRPFKAPPKKLAPLPKGSIAKLYRHYLYLFGIFEHASSERRMHFLLAEDLRALASITREAKLLDAHNITTDTELKRYRAGLDEKMKSLCTERKTLRSKLRKATPPNNLDALNERLTHINAEIKAYRAEVKDCDSIEKRSDILREKIERIQAQDNSRDKETRCKTDGRDRTSS